MEEHMNLFDKIDARTAQVGVIGLGYVGLPLAVAFARTGYPTTGIDMDQNKVGEINAGRSYIPDVPAATIADLVARQQLHVTADYAILSWLDVVFICVPTPYTPAKAPDISYIETAARGIAAHLHPGQLIVLQSTTYPGTTEEYVLPILEKGGLKAGVDFHLAFSPERVDPGNRSFTVANTPKVVGGLTPGCARIAARLLEQITPDVRIVSTPRAAELTKLLENTFRSVNIALVNELALLCERMGIDVWEVIEAASSKPFGFMPFTPGPGVGGHCIPVDPYYLSWKAREYDFYTKFIELAAEVNQSMPYHVAQLVESSLGDHGRTLPGAEVLILGVAFKRDIDDARNSPADTVMELLLQRGARVRYNDPYVPCFTVGEGHAHGEPRTFQSTPLDDDALRQSDVVVILAGHSGYDFAHIVSNARLVVDTVNATRNVPFGRERIVRIGAPHPYPATRSPGGLGRERPCTG
jgi:UDP-N-acetyl-D-glucosamine dehydrogenase